MNNRERKLNKNKYIFKIHYKSYSVIDSKGRKRKYN